MCIVLVYVAQITTIDWIIAQTRVVIGWLLFVYVLKYKNGKCKVLEKHLAALRVIDVQAFKKFNVLLTVHHAMILVNCPTWCTNSFQYIYLFIVLYMFRACHAVGGSVVC